MLKQYGNLIGELLKNVFNGKTEVSLLECVKIAGSGVLLMVILVVLLAVISGVFYLPRKGYFTFTKKARTLANDLICSGNANETCLKEALIALNIRRFIFWLGFVVLYIPICIPTVLYIISLLCY